MVGTHALFTMEMTNENQVIAAPVSLIVTAGTWLVLIIKLVFEPPRGTFKFRAPTMMLPLTYNGGDRS